MIPKKCPGCRTNYHRLQNIPRGNLSKHFTWPSFIIWPQFSRTSHQWPFFPCSFHWSCPAMERLAVMAELCPGLKHNAWEKHVCAKNGILIETTEDIFVPFVGNLLFCSSERLFLSCLHWFHKNADKMIKKVFGIWILQLLVKIKGLMFPSVYLRHHCKCWDVVLQRPTGKPSIAVQCSNDPFIQVYCTHSLQQQPVRGHQVKWSFPGL